MDIGEPTKQDFSMNCLKCGKQLDGFMAVDNDKARPRTGDVSLCMYCQHIMIFAGPVDITGNPLPATGVREATTEEFEMIARDPEIQASIRASRQLKKPWKLFLYSDR